ncbi:hypothetical protein WN943_000721 [Citrus x changshan-huyou]
MMPWKKASDCCSWDGVTSDVAQYFQELIISVFPHLTTRIVRNYLKEWRKRKSQLEIEIREQTSEKLGYRYMVVGGLIVYHLILRKLVWLQYPVV